MLKAHTLLFLQPPQWQNMTTHAFLPMFWIHVTLVNTFLLIAVDMMLCPKSHYAPELGIAGSVQAW